MLNYKHITLTDEIKIAQTIFKGLKAITERYTSSENCTSRNENKKKENIRNTKLLVGCGRFVPYSCVRVFSCSLYMRSSSSRVCELLEIPCRVASELTWRDASCSRHYHQRSWSWASGSHRWLVIRRWSGWPAGTASRRTAGWYSWSGTQRLPAGPGSGPNLLE